MPSAIKLYNGAVINGSLLITLKPTSSLTKATDMLSLVKFGGEPAYLSYHWFAAAIFQPVTFALISPPLL